MKISESAGGVVVNKGLVLIVKQIGKPQPEGKRSVSSFSWSLPKGHVEKGETFPEAARREIYEESGVKELEFVKELGVYERHRLGPNGKEDDKTELKRIHIFLFTTKQNELKPIDPNNPEARWVTKEKALEMLTHPKDREFFMGVVGGIGC